MCSPWHHACPLQNPSSGKGEKGGKARKKQGGNGKKRGDLGGWGRERKRGRLEPQLLQAAKCFGVALLDDGVGFAELGRNPKDHEEKLRTGGKEEEEEEQQQQQEEEEDDEGEGDADRNRCRLRASASPKGTQSRRSGTVQKKKKKKKREQKKKRREEKISF
jgi:hypothetical protein